MFDQQHEFYSEHFKNLDLSGQMLCDKEFEDCLFIGCNFSETTLKRCNFIDCEFRQCNFSVANIEYSKFSDVVFLESKLIGINWNKINWPNLLFNAPVKFDKCVLNDCSFFGLTLPELKLIECKAHNVDFREGNFNKADFSYSDFTGSLFNKTDLSSANFCEAQNYNIDIFNNTLKQAKFTRIEALRLLDTLDIELQD